MDLHVLENLGLTKNEIRIYLCLLSVGSSPAGIITEKTGIHRRNVYDCIERLIEKGLIGYIVVKGRKFFDAVDPKYFNRLFEEKKEEIDEFEKKFQKIYPNLRSLYSESKGKQEITFYRGVEAIKLLLNNVIDNKVTNHVLGAQDLIDEHKSLVDKYHTRRIKNKISEKIIFEKNSNRGKIVSKLPFIEAKYFPIPFNSELTINIYGDRVALLLFSEGEPLSIMIKNKNIYSGFLNYFRMLWNISIPISN